MPPARGRACPENPQAPRCRGGLCTLWSHGACKGSCLVPKTCHAGHLDSQASPGRSVDRQDRPRRTASFGRHSSGRSRDRQLAAKWWVHGPCGVWKAWVINQVLFFFSFSYYNLAHWYILQGTNQQQAKKAHARISGCPVWHSQLA